MTRNPLFRVIVFGALAAGTAACAAPSAPAPRIGVEERAAAAPDGVRIAYDVRGSGSRAVVLVHGWRCDRALWRWTAEDLARDHTVVRVDLGGHGASGADRARWDIEALAGDVVAVLDDLGLHRAVVVGHSMGGPIGLAAARRAPGRVAAVVGVDTLHDVEFRWPKEQIEPVMAAFERDPEGALRGAVPMMLAPGADPALEEWLVRSALGADERAAAAIMRALTEADLAALLRGAGVPVRCVNAAAGSTPFTMATAPETNRRHGDFDAVYIAGVGHYPMLERPFTFTARLREVLADLDAGARGGPAAR